MNNEQNPQLHKYSVMPCFIFFKDRQDIERIGIAEKPIDDDWFVIWFNSTTRDVCKYEDAVLCPYQNKA